MPINRGAACRAEALRTPRPGSEMLRCGTRPQWQGAPVDEIEDGDAPQRSGPGGSVGPVLAWRARRVRRRLQFHIAGRKSHAIVAQGLKILENLNHRGSVAPTR